MSEHSLNSHELLCLSAAGGSEIRVREGVLWLTEAGQPGDVILHPGQSYRVRGSGLLVCEPLTGSARLLVRRNRWRLAVRLLRLLATGLRRGSVRRVGAAQTAPACSAC